MSSRAVAITVIVVVAGTIGAGGVIIYQNSKTTKSKPRARTTAPKPPSLRPMCRIDVDGTLAVESSKGGTQLSESYELTGVWATKDGADPAGTYKGSGVDGTFEGTGTQSLLNTTEKYSGKVTKGSITFSLTDGGYGTLSGQGALLLTARVTDGTATNKYGTKPIAKTTTTVKIPIKVVVEGGSATISATGGSGSLMGTFVPKQ